MSKDSNSFEVESMEEDMKRNHAYAMVASVVLSLTAVAGTAVCPAYAAETSEASEAVVYDGVKVGPVEVGGMTKEEAKAAVEAYMEELRSKKITLALEGSDDKKIESSMAEVGLSWANPDVFDNIDQMGKSGNVIRRYKVKKDLAYTETSLDLEIAVDDAKIRAWIEANLGTLESPAVDAVIQKTEQGFSITPEQVGSTVDIEASILAVKNYMLESWNYEDCTVSLVGAVQNPRVTAAECAKIQSTPMAEFTTSYTSSGSSRCKNIDAAVSKINGAVLMPGDKFSCLEHMLPFTAENGYFPAGSYMGGMLVDSYGGGVCQVSTTLYNSVLLAELEVNQRYNHGLTVGYVQLSSDAAIAESSGMDFAFTNNTNAPIYIEGYTKDKRVTFNIYGLDERPANRKVEYKNTVIEVINPPEDVIKEDPSLPEGARKVTQSSHTGYRAELYKYVYVDGVQVSKEKVNSSYYAPAPNYISVGPGATVSEEPSSENPENPEDVPAVVDPADQQNSSGTPDNSGQQNPSGTPDNSGQQNPSSTPDDPGQQDPYQQGPSGTPENSDQQNPSGTPDNSYQQGPSGTPGMPSQQGPGYSSGPGSQPSQQGPSGPWDQPVG